MPVPPDLTAMPIRLALLGLLLTLPFAGCAPAAEAPEPADPAPALILLLERQDEAWNEDDLERFVSDYAEDATFLGSSGLIRGRDAILARYRNAYGDDPEGLLSFEDLDVTPLGAEAALVLGRYRLTYDDRPDATGSFTLVFRHTPDGWTILHDHTSADAAPPDAPASDPS